MAYDQTPGSVDTSTISPTFGSSARSTATRSRADAGQPYQPMTAQEYQPATAVRTRANAKSPEVADASTASGAVGATPMGQPVPYNPRIGAAEKAQGAANAAANAPLATPAPPTPGTYRFTTSDGHVIEGSTAPVQPNPGDAAGARQTFIQNQTQKADDLYAPYYGPNNQAQRGAADNVVKQGAANMAATTQETTNRAEIARSTADNIDSQSQFPAAQQKDLQNRQTSLEKENEQLRTELGKYQRQENAAKPAKEPSTQPTPNASLADKQKKSAARDKGAQFMLQQGRATSMEDAYGAWDAMHPEDGQPQSAAPAKPPTTQSADGMYKLGDTINTPAGAMTIVGFDPKDNHPLVAPMTKGNQNTRPVQ